MKLINIRTLDGAKIIKDNEVYKIEDIDDFHERLVTSKTTLHAGQETGGHTHPNGEEEVYFFTSGAGKMVSGKHTALGYPGDRFSELSVEAGDIALIEGNEYHKVINDGAEDLIFFCVFEKYTRT